MVLVDGRQDLAQARDLCRLIRTTGSDAPLLLIVTEGGLSVVAADWGMDDVLLATAGPAEVEARLRLSIGRLAAKRDPEDPEAHVIRSGEVTVDDATYTAKLGGRPLDLTFKEFELLKFLAQHPGRVFTRQQLLQEVWGYDYFGGTRTVDVRTPAPREARPGERGAHRHGPQRRLPVRAAAERPGRLRGGRRYDGHGGRRGPADEPEAVRARGHCGRAPPGRSRCGRARRVGVRRPGREPGPRSPPEHCSSWRGPARPQAAPSAGRGWCPPGSRSRGPASVCGASERLRRRRPVSSSQTHSSMPRHRSGTSAAKARDHAGFMTRSPCCRECDWVWCGAAQACVAPGSS